MNSEKAEYKGHRIAPSPESRERPRDLDMVVLIPSMNEGVGVLHTLESIATQRQQPGNNFIQGVVVVINNRPNATQDVLASNMKTYAALQALRFGYGLSVGDKELDEKIKRIQQSNIRIEVIDAFSEGHAHPESNVGRARKLGSDHGLTMLDFSERTGWKDTEKPVIVSTDADTVFGPDALGAVWRAFWADVGEGVQLGSRLRAEDMDEASKNAHRAYTTYWEVMVAAREVGKRNHALKCHMMYGGGVAPNAVEKGLVTMGGASSAFSAEIYKKTGGYKPMGTAEDTELGFSIVEAGGVLANINDDKQAVVFTQPRISKRTDNGFGHSIARWDEREHSFPSVQVDHPLIESELEAFFAEIEHNLMPNPSEEEMVKLCDTHDMPVEVAKRLWSLYELWGGVKNSKAHYEFIHQSRDFFEKKHGTISMTELVDYLEKANAELSSTAEKYKQLISRTEVNADWTWESFSSYMTDILKELGIERPNQDENVDLRFRIRAVIAAEYGNTITTVIQRSQMIAIDRLMDVIKESGADANKVAASLPTLFVDERLTALGRALRAVCTSSVIENSLTILHSKLTEEERTRFEKAAEKHKAELQAAWQEFERLEEQREKELKKAE